MRVLCLIAAVLASLLAGAGPAAAAGTTHHQFSFRGSSALAQFPGLPPGAIPQPGVVYTDTTIWAGEQMFNVDGTRQADDTVHLDQFSYRYTAEGQFERVAAVSGRAHGAAVTFAVSGDVSRASAAAQVPVTRCEYVAGTSYCVDGGSRAVRVTWTGTGDAGRGMQVSTWSSGGSRYVSRSSGVFRAATATATIEGADLGASAWSSISRSRSGSIEICHGC